MAEDMSPIVTRSPVTPDTLMSVTALARFEFEPAKGNEGTKVLMVEWQDDDRSRSKNGSWQVSWSEKCTTFPADDGSNDNIRRVYFMLPPGVIVPPHITLAYRPPSSPRSNKSKAPSEPAKMTVNPLPAIFTPELGATAKASGKKGVLHTIWAKKRLQVLDREIKQEQEQNLEGIALEIALAEKEWIENSFGLQPKPPTLDLGTLPKFSGGPASPGVQSPRSPGGRRLSEKLKGLSISTNEKDLAGRGVNTISGDLHPLSPENSDIAYSSFSTFHNGPTASRNTTSKKVVSAAPPEYIRKQQQQMSGSSLGSMSKSKADGNDDGLFAVALSPRSPDIPKSPFSMSSSEVGAFAKIKGEKP